jgi:hypothetical protein
MSRRPTAFALAALAATLFLAACGGSPPVPPAPTLTLTGVTPAIALPGETVSLAGSAFEAGQAVTFDGVPATVSSVAADGTGMAVVVPDVGGYPRIEVDEVALERALFVGHAYAGPLTLDGIQAELDALPEGATLRVGPGTYTGTDLALDNRSLYGAGPSSVLQPTVLLQVNARSQGTTVLADLRVEGGDLIVTRGRFTTSAAEPPAAFATVLLTDLALDVGLFVTPNADAIELVLRDSALDAASVQAAADLGRLRIEGSTITAASGFIAQNTHGIVILDAQLTADTGPIVLFSAVGIDVARSDLVAPDGLTVVTQLGPVELDDVTATTDGAIQIQAYGPLTVQGSTLTSTAGAITVFSIGAVSVDDSVLSAGGALTFQAALGEALIDGSTLTASTDLTLGVQGSLALGASNLTAGTGSIQIEGLTGLEVVGSTLTSGASISVFSSLGDLDWRGTSADADGEIMLNSQGRSTIADAGFVSATGGLVVVAQVHGVIERSTIDVETQAVVIVDRGVARVLDTDLTSAAGSVLVDARGAVVVEGGSVTATAGTLVLQSSFAGDVTLRGSAGIAANDVVVSAGALPYAGTNGTVTIVGNGAIEATTSLTVNAPYSDVTLADNGPVVAGGVFTLLAGGSHVTLRDNARLESGADLTVAAPAPGGRITATGNAFVANAGAGTITLDTVAGHLLQSGNVFTGTTSFPNNP